MSPAASANGPAGTSRRTFLRNSALLISATAGAELAIGLSGYAAGSGTIKLGLVGDGGRDSGAAADALSADANTQLWAMADVLADKIKTSFTNLTTQFTTVRRIGAEVLYHDQADD